MPRLRMRAARSLSPQSAETFDTFGELLRYLRKSAGLTQRELGQAVGYSESQIARLEGGRRLPDPVAVKAHFAEPLGLQREPEIHRRLIELATAARGDAPRPALPTPPEPAERARRERQGLPTPLTGLIGRGRDIATALQILRRKEVRLVTLLGPPGVGKTRLGIEVARQASGNFADGVCFVPLAPVADPALVAATLAQALGVGATQADPLAGVRLYLRDKHLLLVLDNFEHLTDAAPLVAEVLAAAPYVQVIATSRAALHLSGEYVVDVLPLASASAVELFVARAGAVQSNFALSPENRAVVEEICRRVDGLPLAIELAAARMRLFGPQALLARLEGADPSAHPALDVLAEGPRDLPARQRTLRATVAWSYGLLTADQQRLLRHLSVFAGGCSLEAASAVAGHPSSFDADLQALLESSLVQHHEGPDGEPRIGLLEMIREFAAEQLAACGEVELAHGHHATYYLGLVKRSAPGDLRQANSPYRLELLIASSPWVKQLQPEYDNLRAALAWSLGGERDSARGAELAVWLFWIWYTHGPWCEAVHWLERALAQTEGAAPSLARARLLIALAWFVGPVGDAARAVEAAREALAVFKSSGDESEVAFALWVITDALLERNHLAEARCYGEEWLALAREWPGRPYVYSALFTLGEIALCQQDFARAAALFDESLSAGPERNWGVQNQQGTLACHQGDYDRAAALCEEALAGMQGRQFTHGTATALHSLGDIALCSGDVGQARARFTEGLRLFGETGNRQRAVWCLGGLAATEAAAGDAARAVTLWAAAEAIHAAIGSPRPALRVEDYRQRVEAARGRLDERELAAASTAGRAMGFDQAVAYALQAGEANESPGQQGAERPRQP